MYEAPCEGGEYDNIPNKVKRVTHPNSRLHCVHGELLTTSCMYCDPAVRQQEQERILARARPSKIDSHRPTVVESSQ